MKKILLLLCILSVSLFANIGKITALKGDVIIQRDAQEIKAKVGSTLDLKDTLITKDKSKALLLFNDKTSITVGKNSTMNMESFVYDLQQPSKDKATFKFGKGLFRTITGQIGKINKKKFKIKAKSASIGIRGTVFDVAVSKDATKVGVVEGGIYYVDTATMKSFDVKKGENLVYDDTTGGVKISVGKLEETKQMDKDSKEMKKEEQKALAKENKKEEKKKNKKEDKKKEEKKKDKKEDKKNNTKENKKQKSEAKKEDTVKEDKKKSEDKKQESVAKQESKDKKQESVAKKETQSDDNSNDKQQTQKTAQNDDNRVLAKQRNEEAPVDNTPAPKDTEQTPIDNTPAPNADTNNFGKVDTGAMEQDTVPVALNNPIQSQPNISVADTLNDNLASAQDSANDIQENQAPTLSISNPTFDEDSSSNSITLTATDPDGDSLRYELASNPTNGTATINSETGEIVYTPNSDFSGTDTLKVIVSDTSGKTDTQQATITINPINDLPIVSFTTSTIVEDTIASTITTTATDVDGDTLTYAMISNPANGTATIDPATGEIVYTPNSNFAGTDTITVVVSDGNGGEVEQTVTMNIEAVNDLPTLVVSNPTFNEDSSSNSIIPTATDVDGDTLSYSIDRTPTNGTATINSTTGEILYTPNSDFAGTDTITVVVSDGNGGIAEKTVIVTVTNIPENPTGEISSLTDGIAQITGDLLPQDNLGSVDYGFIVPTGETTSANAIDTYISGTITPDAVIENYISSGATASYSGGIAALVDGTASNGNININVDFGTQSVTGNLNISQGNWSGIINSGSVSSYGFNSSDITGTSDYGSITSGTMDGKFYGADASNVGGRFHLSTSTTSANGAFGAKGTVTNQ